MKRFSSIILLASAFFLVALYIFSGTLFGEEPETVTVNLADGEITITQQGNFFSLSQKNMESQVYRNKQLCITGAGRALPYTILIQGKGLTEAPLQITLRDVEIQPPDGDPEFSALTLRENACAALFYEGKNLLGSGAYKAGLTCLENASLFLADPDNPGKFLSSPMKAGTSLSNYGNSELSFDERELAYIESLGLPSLLAARKGATLEEEGRPSYSIGLVGSSSQGGSRGGSPVSISISPYGTGSGGGSAIYAIVRSANTETVLWPDYTAGLFVLPVATIDAPHYSNSGSSSYTGALAGVISLPADDVYFSSAFWSAYGRVLSNKSSYMTDFTVSNQTLANNFMIPHISEPLVIDNITYALPEVSGIHRSSVTREASISEDKLQLVIAGLTNSLTVSLPKEDEISGEPSNENIITRAVLITVLYELTTDVLPNEYQNISVFNDVAADSWYGPPVAWAKEKDLIQGVSKFRFAPERGINRQEMAQILNQYLFLIAEHPSGTFPLPDFADSHKISSWAKTAVADIYGLGIMKEKSGNLFDPTAYVTKEEFRDVLVCFSQL